MYDTVLAGPSRTHDVVEVWHNGFQKLVVLVSHPTLWTFLTALKKEENLTCSKKVKMRLGEGPEPKCRKWRMYDVDDFDPMDYLQCIGEMLFTS